MHTLYTLITSIVVVAAAACSKQAPPAKSPAPAAEAEAEEDVSKMPKKTPKRAAVEVGPKIEELCDLPSTSFDFDSDGLSDDAKSVLDSIAACFIDGAAQGKNMNLVGHTDPRGTEEYNMQLGQRRADAVAKYFLDKGLTEDRMATSSRGEEDAAGTDEESWTEDRRVEITLAE